jgi:hypothetical protein
MAKKRKQAQTEEQAVTEATEAVAEETTETTGDTQAPVVEPEEPVVEEPKAPTTNKPQLSSTANVVLQQLEEYVSVMSPPAIVDVNVGVQMQTQLFNAFGTMLSLDGEELYAVHKTILATIRKNRKGAFGEQYLFRYFDALRLNAQRAKAFERTLNLYLQAADVKSVASLAKVVDIEATAASWEDSERSQKLTTLFTA